MPGEDFRLIAGKTGGAGPCHPRQEIHHAPAHPVRFQQAIFHQTRQHFCDIRWVIGRNFPQTGMADHSLGKCCHQGYPLQFRQSGKPGAQVLFQFRQGFRWNQAGHAQFHQCLFRLGQFVKQRTPPVLARPVAVNFRNARTGMVAVSHQLKQGLQASVAAIAGAALDRQGQWHPHQSGVAKSEHVGPLDHQN